ncbi:MULTISPECIES: 4-(cytidine 5'-diphospho)-2-C-methyl-D-erythritol kinase [unclassified Sphingomonas]|uniref:4-(cytidine 5'-diphospho)-2-C-methyl-D-erythritol kinase n=1 Tax=unclassified Sphingomonas TaxID=196159 RepID=UPI0009EA1D42|nr:MULTISPECIES: 4-(cytidine 5'-diphospho)-2-C-methyl-D-erythritol kinase [unclassified Sphingomonas]
MTVEIVEAAPAKLNLALHVRARRDDGYHELDTLFVFVRDGDDLRIVPADADRFTITGPFASALDPAADNLVTRARDLFRREIAPAPPVAIELVKRLPVASGIGGGSADAAATLRALARLTGIAPDDARLVAVAGRLGSDVPACLLGRAARGSGRGEQLIEIAGLPGRPVLLVNPGVAVSTARVFAGWDGVDRGGIGEGALIDIAQAGRNDLQPAACAIAPVIADALGHLSALPGAAMARMSGSGATCFALFDDRAACAAAATITRDRHPDWWCLETVLT